MLTYLFGGKLGELVAPRPSSEKEIWAYIKVIAFGLVEVTDCFDNGSFCRTDYMSVQSKHFVPMDISLT